VVLGADEDEASAAGCVDDAPSNTLSNLMASSVPGATWTAPSPVSSYHYCVTLYKALSARLGVQQNMLHKPWETPAADDQWQFVSEFNMGHNIKRTTAYQTWVNCNLL